MKKTITTAIIGLAALCGGAAELFFYSPANGEGGLRFAVSDDGKTWRGIGNGTDFVRSDFGSWGPGKKMWRPRLYNTSEGWICLFQTDKEGEVTGAAKSPDLINWMPQEYYSTAVADNFDFIKEASFRPQEIELDGKKITGYALNADDATIARLESHAKERARLAALYSEHCDKDPERFAGLQPLYAKVTASGVSREISPLLMGIFFEDISHAADGGLYAELIQNRDFEYSPGENWREKDWGPSFAWSVSGDNLSLTISEENPLHANNPHFARLEIKSGLPIIGNRNGLVNNGFDGISLKKGASYRFRLKARANKKIPVGVELADRDGKKLASGKFNVKKSEKWDSYELVLTATADCANSSLHIIPGSGGILDLDMVSLFPVDTYKGRDNGLRKDLAQTLADLKPRFVRFPGGCVAHGNGIDNIYDWKGSIGNLEERKPLSNLWGYHQTRGLGYYEYFLFCEDIGAEPLPVVAAGVPCQNSSVASRYSKDKITSYGQQGGIPMEHMEEYIQDVLDLIEYANGDTTTEWGRKRAEAGHPEPFNLKYIGIGNEDMITEVFKERFEMINSAVKKAYPEITVIGTVGPFYEGADYEEGWRLAKDLKVDMVDEHYYVDPAWLIYNQNFYDSYDRKGTKVYLGEWAAHLPGRPSNIETALSEALYLTSVERNGDVVSMSSYAPLLAKEGHTHWRPDLVYFSNTAINLTPDYHTMRLYGENSGTRYFDAEIDVATENDKVRSRFGVSIVKDDVSGDVIVKAVNLLPVETTVDVDLRKLFTDSKSLSSVRTVMSGSPADEKGKLVTDRVSLESPLFTLPLSPYSFTVLRIK